jgi:hypothetical protein
MCSYNSFKTARFFFFFLTACVRQHLAFDKDELLGCFQVPLSRERNFYTNIARALRNVERAAAITDTA